MDELEPRPCPFCGGEAIVNEFIDSDGKDSCKCCVVICKNCGCQTQRYEYFLGITKRNAIEAWNRRVDNDLALSNA